MPAFRRLQRFLEKKQVAQFRAYVNAANSLQTCLVELFIQTRFRRYVLAYLSVQEGEDFEGASSYDTEAGSIIDGSLRSFGKESMLAFCPGAGKLRLRFSLDPLLNLRVVYALGLVRKGDVLKWKDRFTRGYHLAAFKFKCTLLNMVLRFAGPFLLRKRGLSGVIRQLIAGKNGQRIAVLSILLIFPKSRNIDEAGWKDLLRFLEDYFSARIPELLSVIPEESLRSNGLIKLAKVFFGTLVGSSACDGKWNCDAQTFVINSIRLAYSWGVTYPLVDNILDSAKTSPQLRDAICELVRVRFSNNDAQGNVDYSSPALVQLDARLREVSSLIPDANREQAQTLLQRLLDVHERDAKRRLDGERVFDEQEIIEETKQKAALVRLATMELCGIGVDAETVARCEERGLFNQLGDDLWDIYEDFSDNRVTAFTNFLVAKPRCTSNPFEYYVAYSTRITDGMSRYRRYATLLGCAESFRDLFLTFSGRSEDSLGVWPHIAGVLKSQGIDDIETFLSQVPHVDFDAVLFEAERAVLDRIL